jgi:alkylation response protein AidB-like acyl-CoA dehydrogenase
MTIDLDLDQDQRQVLASIQELLADKFPLSRMRAGSCGDRDRGALGQLAALGWLGLGVEEGHGGAGFTLAEDVLLFRELGRHLVTPSVLASSLGAHIALALGRTDLAREIMEGTVRPCLANRLHGLTSAGPSGTYTIYDSAGAEYLVLWDSSEIACQPFRQVSAVEPGRCIDRSVSLLRATVVTNGEYTLAGDAARRLRLRAELLVAAQLLGIAEGALDLAVGYAKLRRQFGQPIGSFQAIKHRCADMKVRAKLLSALVLMASLSEREGRNDAALQIAAARLLAARYAIENAATGIQIHGAMGFTAECDAHLFLMRAHLLENIGSTSTERELEMASLPE